MDHHGLSREEVAKMFGVSPLTIYNWRSQGLPHKHAIEFYRISRGPLKDPIGQRFILEPTREQNLAWQRAAAASGKTLDEWMVDALESWAKEEAAKQRIARVAEEGNRTYGQGKQPAASPAPNANPNA